MATGIYGLAGPSIVIENLANQLGKKGVDVTIGASIFKRTPPTGAYRISTIPTSNFLKLAKFMKSYDIIHCHHPILNFTDLLCNVPFIYHCHGAPNFGKGSLYRFSMISSIKATNHRFAAAIAISNSGYKELTRYINAEKVHVIRNGVDTSIFRHETTDICREGVPQFLFVGNLFEYKKVDELIIAMKKLVKAYPKAHLQIIGQGESMTKLKSLVNQLDLQNHISLKGIIQNNCLPSYYSSCDVYVTASRCEQVPLPLLEAWACGKPVVASSIPCHKELLLASNGGESYDAGNIINLCSTLSDVYENKDEFKKFALQFAKQNDWSIVADRLTSIYRKLLD